MAVRDLANAPPSTRAAPSLETGRFCGRDRSAGTGTLFGDCSTVTVEGRMAPESWISCLKQEHIERRRAQIRLRMCVPSVGCNGILPF